MVTCYRCGATACCKNGWMQGQQRYKCKVCAYNFINKPRRGYSRSIKALAVLLYVSGLSQRRIAKLCGVSPVSILKWIRQFATQQTRGPHPPTGSTIVVELDEIWDFLKKNPQSLGSGRRIVVIQDSSLIGNVGVVINAP